MTFLFWALVVILGLALLNGIACWFGLDVSQEAESLAPGSHGDEVHGDEVHGPAVPPSTDDRLGPRGSGLSPASQAAGSSHAAGAPHD